MSLSETVIRTAQPKSKPYKMSDGGGLHLLIQPNGSKLWRLKYRFGGKEGLLSFGPYPAVTIADARNKQYRARQRLETGQDPRQELGGKPDGQTFEAAARCWYDNRRHSLDPAHAARILSRMERDLLPILGPRGIRDITPPEVLAVLRGIEARGALEICRRAKQSVSQIFRFAIASGWTEHDPTTCLDDALRPRHSRQHMRRIAPGAMPGFLASLAAYDDDCSRRRAVTRSAILFTLLTWARTKEVRFATVEEFEGLAQQKPIWRIPAERMKMRRDHVVPLSVQAAALVRDMLGQRREGYVFTDGDDVPISQNRMIGALYRMGYRGRQTVHGFRGLASTWANESGRYRPDWIESALAHGGGDAVRAAYNSAEYLDMRRRMLQDWANYIDVLNVEAAKDCRLTLDRPAPVTEPSRVDVR